MKKHILVVDDDQTTLKALVYILERENYHVVSSLSGKLLLDELAQPPDLIILDRRLSGMDGIEVCKYLKKKPATKHIPVILLSASSGMDILAKEAGADDSIEKPFDFRDLLEKIAKHLKDICN